MHNHVHKQFDTWEKSHKLSFPGPARERLPKRRLTAAGPPIFKQFLRLKEPVDKSVRCARLTAPRHPLRPKKRPPRSSGGRKRVYTQEKSQNGKRVTLTWMLIRMFVARVIDSAQKPSSSSGSIQNG